MNGHSFLQGTILQVLMNSIMAHAIPPSEEERVRGFSSTFGPGASVTAVHLWLTPARQINIVADHPREQ